MYDSSLAHFSCNLYALGQHVSRAVIGQGGSVIWRACSSDISTLGFYLWQHLKPAVYATEGTGVRTSNNRYQMAMR